ncbi:MAG: Na+/H+ antiporter NhaC family protein [Acidobacteriota bacterium]
MQSESFSRSASTAPLEYYGGLTGSLFPFLLFVAGVIAVALSGAPNERGFWPVLLAALTLALLLARDKRAYCEVVIEGLSRPILMIMILAWLLASVLGVLMSGSGFIEALTWLAGQLHLTGRFFVGAAFVTCCLVSASTGTSLGTILVCGPLLYPAGLPMGAEAAPLAGAILGGSTFGDSISPISDTTIASALSQKADIGGTVRSRLKYVLPAAALALVLYLATGGESGTPAAELALSGNPRALPMILVPLLILTLLLRGRHLLEGLLLGLLAGVALGLSLGLLPPHRILSLDPSHFTAHSFIIEGIDRGIGISVFTIFLLALVSGLEAGGVVDRLLRFSQRYSRSRRSAETWISAAVGVAVLLTTHSIVAILTVGEFARQSGERFGIHRYRRANLLDLTVVTFPFLLPYCIPVILASTVTSNASDGLVKVSPLQVGAHNFFSWATLLVLIASLITGFGSAESDDTRHLPRDP